jgi:hypothetical protein
MRGSSKGRVAEFVIAVIVIVPHDHVLNP